MMSRLCGGRPHVVNNDTPTRQGLATQRLAARNEYRGVILVGSYFLGDMVMRLEETTIRFAPETLKRLRTIAHLRSLESGKTVTWNGMVRQLVEAHLQTQAEG